MRSRGHRSSLGNSASHSSGVSAAKTSAGPWVGRSDVRPRRRHLALDEVVPLSVICQVDQHPSRVDCVVEVGGEESVKHELEKRRKGMGKQTLKDLVRHAFGRDILSR